jgi:hypothetical protein
MFPLRVEPSELEFRGEILPQLLFYGDCTLG